MHHKTLSNLEEEYLEYHDKLQHTPHADIFNLCRYGHLPRKCLKLEKNILLMPPVSLEIYKD